MINININKSFKVIDIKIVNRQCLFTKVALDGRRRFFFDVECLEDSKAPNNARTKRTS